MAHEQNSLIKVLENALPQVGAVVWLGLRPGRRLPVRPMDEVQAAVGQGLLGDHFNGDGTSRRQVTLLQYEHLKAVASFLGRMDIDPALLRRNIVVKAINLLALKDKQFGIGEALMEMTGHCHPCSRMEEALGEGGFNALRGHGGVTARVVRGGIIRLGDRVRVDAG